jgi:membrane-associated phospholipid phosphatase
MPDTILEWGLEVVLVLQAGTGWMVGPMQFFSALGFEEFFFFVLPGLYWCVDTRIGVRVGLYLALSGWIAFLGKLGFADPRPYWVSAEVELLTRPENNFGILSGHAQNAVVLWGGLAHIIKKSWVWLIAILLMLLIGGSRVVLGAHFPTDVLAGWTTGIILLILLIRFEGPVVAWLTSYDWPRQIGIIFLLSVTGVLISAGVSRAFVDPGSFPISWISNAARYSDEHFAPQAFSGSITSLATTFGLLAGHIWLDQRQGFDAGGSLTVRVLRFLVGLVGAVVFWQGLDVVFSLLAGDETLLGYLLRFLRYTIVGLWITLLGPLTFFKLKLAKPLRSSSRSV